MAHPSWRRLRRVAHPYGGFDHLLAMVAVGLFAARQNGMLRWALPTGFVAAMLAGALLGAQGFAMPQLESGVAASVLILGLLVAFMVRLPVTAAMALVVVMALFHGQAHQAEMPAGRCSTSPPASRSRRHRCICSASCLHAGCPAASRRKASSGRWGGIAAAGCFSWPPELPWAPPQAVPGRPFRPWQHGALSAARATARLGLMPYPRISSCQTVLRPKRHPTCCSMRTILSTGGRGATRRGAGARSGQTDPPVHRLFGVPLVPCDGT